MALRARRAPQRAAQARHTREGSPGRTAGPAPKAPQPQCPKCPRRQPRAGPHQRPHESLTAAHTHTHHSPAQRQRPRAHIRAHKRRRHELSTGADPRKSDARSGKITCTRPTDHAALLSRCDHTARSRRFPKATPHAPHTLLAVTQAAAAESTNFVPTSRVCFHVHAAQQGDRDGPAGCV